MPFPLLMPLIGMGVSAAGNYLNNRSQAKARASSTSMPTMSPEYMGLQNALLPSITRRLTNPSGLPAGYETGGIAKINRTYDLGKQSIDNNLTARGLGGSPIAGAAGTRLETGRLGTISDFQQEMPMVARDMQNEDMRLAMSALQLGRGQTSNSTSDNGQGGIGGLFGNLLQGAGTFIGSSGWGTPKLPNRMNPMDYVSGYRAPVAMNRPN